MEDAAPGQVSEIDFHQREQAVLVRRRNHRMAKFHQRPWSWPQKPTREILKGIGPRGARSDRRDRHPEDWISELKSGPS
jgi:hypothetical protein